MIAAASALSAKAACQKDDEAHKQDETNSATAYGGPSEVKAAAAKQEKKDDDEKNEVHGPRVSRRPHLAQWGLHPPKGLFGEWVSQSIYLETRFPSLI